MICRLRNEDSPVAQLMTTLHSKSNVKWRIKVLERLAIYLYCLLTTENFI